MLDKTKRYLIVGLGLLGGKYALELSKAGFHVDGINRSEGHLQYALDHGYIETGKTHDFEDLVSQADHIIFVQPNWQDSDPMFTKGYKLRVFTKGFSYDDGPKGRVGLLPGKTFYTIMNAGWLGQGKGQSGDSLAKNPQEWETWMFAFRVVDDDAAVGKDMRNLGRFCNDRTPANLDPAYGEKIEKLRGVLRDRLTRDFADYLK